MRQKVIKKLLKSYWRAFRADGKAMLDRIEHGTYLHPKTKGHREWNDVMVKRLREFLSSDYVGFESGDVYSVIDGTQNDLEEGCYKLIDGNENTKKLAKYVTEEGCEDDGFAKLIHRYVL